MVPFVDPFGPFLKNLPNEQSDAPINGGTVKHREVGITGKPACSITSSQALSSHVDDRLV